MMKKIAAFGTAVLLTVILLAGCSQQPDEETTQAPAISQQGNTFTTLTVTGMRCNRCVNAINTAVRPLEGVIDVVVSRADATAIVEHSTTLDIDLVISAIEEQAGLEVVR